MRPPRPVRGALVEIDLLFLEFVPRKLKTRQLSFSERRWRGGDSAPKSLCAPPVDCSPIAPSGLGRTPGRRDREGRFFRRFSQLSSTLCVVLLIGLVQGFMITPPTLKR